MAEDPPATQRRQQGNSRAYLIGRLKRSNQADLAAAVEAGTVSAFAAAVQCGLAKRPPSKAAVTHQARKRKIRLQAIAGGGLSNGEMMELWLGPSLNGSLFNSRQELEQAWKQHRDEIMARWGRQGRRPQIWWELEAPALGLKWPGYFNEQSYLYDAGALAAEEKAELERAWEMEFERAQAPDFTLNDGSGEILTGDRARGAHYEHHDIPTALVKRWTAARRRRERRSAPLVEEAVAIK